MSKKNTSAVVITRPFTPSEINDLYKQQTYIATKTKVSDLGATLGSQLLSWIYDQFVCWLLR